VLEQDIFPQQLRVLGSSAGGGAYEIRPKRLGQKAERALAHALDRQLDGRPCHQQHHRDRGICFVCHRQYC